jgi:hypothetical protein
MVEESGRVLGGVPVIVKREDVRATERPTVTVTPPFPLARTRPG